MADNFVPSLSLWTALKVVSLKLVLRYLVFSYGFKGCGWMIRSGVDIIVGYLYVGF